ncbi:MAG: enoyl-CoA hydratase/isomerase family protein [Firmicutes bacterium]|nr:enoyl-CoA hydratase/isomerase family protein [Bacillota bacterium]
MLVLTEKKNGVGWLYLNRPEALNSLTAGLVEELSAAIGQLAADDEVRVLVFSGQGRAFCAGGDLASLKALTDEQQAADFVASCGAAAQALYDCPKPVIAMVNGVAAGAGFNLALACDIVLAAEGVKFIQSFSNIGLVPDCGGHYFLPRAIGSWHAKQAMFEASPITAEQGKAYGFVNAIYPAADLAAETAKYAEMLAKRAPLSLQGCKNLLNRGGSFTLAEILAAEAELQGKLVCSADCKEGLAAFAEKRAANFRGK